MSKIVYQNNISEQTNQHHRAGQLKQHPGANKSAPQSKSIKIISMSKIVYQKNISEPTNQHHRADQLK